MRGLLGIALILAACGSDPSWQEVVDDYAQAICQLGADCGAPGDLATCIEDVKADLALTRDALTPEQEKACARCLEATTDVHNSATCEPTDIEDPKIYAACDLDPTVDADGDEITDNDEYEACERPR